MVARQTEKTSVLTGLRSPRPVTARLDSYETAVQLNLIIPLVPWFPSFPEQNGIRLIDELNSTPRKERLTGNNRSFDRATWEGTFPLDVHSSLTADVFT